MTIRVGDKVRVTSFELESDFGVKPGETGTVRRISRFNDTNNLALVRFDPIETRTHEQEWWVYDCDLEVIESDTAEDDDFSLTLAEVPAVEQSINVAIEQTARWHTTNPFISVDETADDPSDDIFREAEEAEEESPVENATIRAFYG